MEQMQRRLLKLAGFAELDDYHGYIGFWKTPSGMRAVSRATAWRLYDERFLVQHYA